MANKPKPTPAQWAFIIIGAVIGAAIGYGLLGGGILGGVITGVGAAIGGIPYSQAVSASRR